MKTEQKWNFKVVFNRSCCYRNYENATFDLSIKIFHRYIFHLPSFSVWAATFLMPWFGKWDVLTNCQNLPTATLSSTFFERRTSTESELFFSFDMRWRYQICVAKRLYSDRDDLPKILFKITAQVCKKPFLFDVRRSKKSLLRLPVYYFESHVERFSYDLEKWFR